MDTREAELQRLVEELCEHPAVVDAFVAKSFTDRLVIVDTRLDETVPEELLERLTTHGCEGSESVYGEDGGPTFAGDVGDATRHHFVDVETRGAHQSYVM
jgi:hypothetical protein